MKDYLNTTSNVANITIVILPYPIPVNDTVETTSNTPIEIDILANDIGVGLLINTVEEVIIRDKNGVGESAGSMTFVLNSTATFTPASGFSGTAVFVYDIVDQNNITSLIKANITITVTIPQGMFLFLLLSFLLLL